MNVSCWDPYLVDSKPSAKFYPVAASSLDTDVVGEQHVGKTLDLGNQKISCVPLISYLGQLESKLLVCWTSAYNPNNCSLILVSVSIGYILNYSFCSMEAKTFGCSSSEDSDGEVYLQNASDEEEFQLSSGSMPKLQFRSVKSKCSWNEEMGMAEVTEKNGKLWVTTGIVRSGKIYSSIEETLYLMELGALHLLDNDGRSMSLMEIYEKVAGGRSGCCWELFEVYRHLKSLGFIIGQHGAAWSLKSIKSSHKPVALEVTEESKQLVDMGSKLELSIDKLFGQLQIRCLRPDFDVYLPNSRFRKSSPGDPNFLLYLSRCHPPSRAEIEDLERQCVGIPLKICLVTEGRVSFYSFAKVELPVLP
ncbi:hypothetical protein VNO77_17070 [Canavalia gladiata]|uniref:tRNA-splicing endonuclease subunit Sen54 N-terminal domain-containing protein n=1 Tax=Canavalia gladiata TaxID=3824 RepID=A0AAN9QIF5_CANGL